MPPTPKQTPAPTPPPPRESLNWMASRASLPRDLSVSLGDLGTLCLELQLPDEMQRVAREELRETEDVVAAGLAALRARIQEEKGLSVPLDDEFLTVALRPCKWHADTAFMRMKSFYAFKARHPHVGRAMPMARLASVAASGVVCILPRRDQHGRRMLLLQTGRKWNPKKVSMDELLCVVLMCMEVALVEPITQVAGVVIIWDLDGLSLSQVLKFTPSFAKMLLHLIQDCVPMRLKAFHFINQSNLFDIAFNVFKPFLRDKLRARLFFHGKDMSSLADHVDPKVLPKQYGGVHEMHFDAEAHVEAFKSFENYFEELGKIGYAKPPK